MRYEVNRYRYGGTHVGAFEDDGMPYADCSVNLTAYGILPSDEYIAIPTYKFTKEDNDMFIADLAEEVVDVFHFGPYDSVATLIRLKEEYVSQLK